MTELVEGRLKILNTLKKPGKQAFWLWILYQTVKGTLTTSLIWVPLAFAWLH